MLDRDFSPDVQRYLERVPRLPHRDVGFLARVRGDPDLVARLVTGTQMGIPLEEQAPYEHHALTLLAPSGITPKPYLVDPNPGGLPYLLILEEFLPGHPLDYATDVPAASPPSPPSASRKGTTSRPTLIPPPPSWRSPAAWRNPTWPGTAPREGAKRPFEKASDA